MLVIFGANGRTGRALVQEAVARGIPVRPVVRDDRDDRGLHAFVDVDLVRYADADHKDAIRPVLDGATAVISAIQPRIAGPGSPPYRPEAAANIIECAVEAGIRRVLHLSVVGAYRWSPNRLNRASFPMDRLVWKLKELPWSMVRVSCFHDEVIDGHVRPPDGRRPHRVVRSARYSPISRRDVARVVLDNLERLELHRTFYLGGPETFTGAELEALVRPFVRPGRGWRRTRAGQLPPGDMSVSQEQSYVGLGARPTDRLADALRAAADGDDAPPAEPPPVYQREEPGRHPADQGRDLKVLRAMGEDLRRVVHAQLAADLARLGHPTEGVELDFRSARPRRHGRTATAHGGTMTELTGVRARLPDRGVVHVGPITFLRDEQAEVFHCWWDDGGGIPDAVWDQLDLGVKRRAGADPAFAHDARARAFAERGHEVTRLP